MTTPSLFAPPSVACPPRPNRPITTPAASPYAMRDYQRRGVDAICRCLREDGSTLLVCPTGTGKTVMLAHAIREFVPPGKRALVLAHRQELIEQNARTIHAVLGEPVAIEMGDVWADMGLSRHRVIVASKDSLHAKRRGRFNVDDFALVIADEAHHATATTYRSVFDHFDGVPILGVTATPDRTDEEALGQVFASVAMVYEITDAIKDGYLVPVRANTVFVESLDLSDIHTVAGDFNVGELSAQLESEKVMYEIAATIQREAAKPENVGRRGLIFTASVRQAQRLSEILNDHVPDSSKWACGETPRDERATILQEHRAGSFRWLVNCALFTEGYDDPSLGFVILARPTKSRSLFAQMLGRGTRPMPGVVDGLADAAARRAAIAESAKPYVSILDFTGVSGRHKLVTPADVLGGNYPQEDVDAASRMLEDENGIDVTDALERAKRAREASRDDTAEAQRVAEIVGNRHKIMALAKYMLMPQDVFGGPVDYVPRERDWARGKPPTEKQLDILEKRGFDREASNQLSRAECSRIISEIFIRQEAGLATLKQCRALSKRGINTAGMTFEAASAAMDRLYGGVRR